MRMSRPSSERGAGNPAGESADLKRWDCGRDPLSFVLEQLEREDVWAIGTVLVVWLCYAVMVGGLR